MQFGPNLAGPLFLDYPAGDAVSRISRRVGLQVISLGMNDQGGAAIAEKRVAVISESYIRVQHFQLGTPIGLHDEIVHITGVMAFRILQAVLLSLRIEMRAGRFEIGRIALCLAVEVQSVLPWRQVMKVEFHEYPGQLSCRCHSTAPPFLRSCLARL